MFLKILKISQVIGEKDNKYKIARIVQFEKNIDCFYKDNLIDEFLEKAYELL